MRNEGAFNVDFSDFEKGFRKIVEDKVPKEAKKGIFDAMAQLLEDAKDKVPRAPWRDGDLWGSTTDTINVRVSRAEIQATGGFNISYAARWHELSPSEDSRISWTMPGSGRKYLESKMMKYKQDYMEIVAESIRGG